MSWICSFALLFAGLAVGGCARTEERPAPAAAATESEREGPAPDPRFQLFQTVDGGESLAAHAELKVNPGSEAAARQYYLDIRSKLRNFSGPTDLTQSSIGNMLDYFGFSQLLATDLEALPSAVIMDFARLSGAVSNPREFAAWYRDQPLLAGEILVTRFFAPKIVNVRDPQVGGVPAGGFGWRKVLRFRARQGSVARSVGLADFYLLFNFASSQPRFPEGVHAAQIQALIVPTYPTGGSHNDIYFLVYEGLGSTTRPGLVGLYLTATFDLAGTVPDDRYYVPTACGQCHGTEVANQVGGKINYLDTDHWIDRTGDDFRLVAAADVLVDGAPLAYATIRQLNQEIERQNAAVTPGSTPGFAQLATRKWLDLHPQGGPDAHAPPLQRGFARQASDPVWTAASGVDRELLPLLNQNCYRCHSSVRFHVFQKAAVVQRKGSIPGRVQGENMPQDRKLAAAVKQKIVDLVRQLGP